MSRRKPYHSKISDENGTIHPLLDTDQLLTLINFALDSMKFRDLLTVKHNSDTDVIDASELAHLLPNTPQEVREQLYVDHGRNKLFQAQYSELEISNIRWSKVSLSASEIADCSYYEYFANWYKSVGLRATQFNTKGWHCIDSRKSVVTHWEIYKTWKASPIFLQGDIMGSFYSLRLVEGHTRVGLLRGLISSDIIDSNSTHQVWIGRQ